jgi:membrane fusion protein
MSMDLFRQEAMEARKSEFGVPIDSNRGLALSLTIALLMLAILLCAYISLGDFTRHVTARGRLLGSTGATRVVSQRGGVISAVYVKEGQYVNKGDPIFTVSSDRSFVDGKSIGESLSRLAIERSASTTQELMTDVQIQQGLVQQLKEKHRIAARQQDALKEELDAFTERRLLAEKTVSDLEPLVTQKLLPLVEFRRYQDAVLALRQSISSAKREIEAGNASLLELHQGLESAKLSLVAATAKVKTEKTRDREERIGLLDNQLETVVAPMSGTVTALTAAKGRVASPQLALANIVGRSSDLAAELWIPSTDIGFVKQGQVVRLMYDSFPYSRFGVGKGKVQFISLTPSEVEDLPKNLESKEPLYRAIVAVEKPSVAAYGKEWPLTRGMALSADVILERTSLIDYVLEPIRAAKQRTSI